jgi:putative oxidoreductase
MDKGSLVLRLGLGIMFVAHGLQMTFGLFGGTGVAGFAEMLGKMGLPHPTVLAYMAALSALLGGICLIIGLATRLATIPLMIFMLVAMIKVHLSKGFFLMNGGYEYTFVILCALVSLLLMGGGKYAITKKI